MSIPEQVNEQQEQQQQVCVEEVWSDVAWVVEPLLQPEECEELMQQATEAGIITQSIAAGDKRYRNCCTHYFRDKDLSQRIWQRLRNSVPMTIEFEERHLTEPPTGFQRDDIGDKLGRWTAYGTNPQFTLPVLYYTAGGHFGPHRDGYKVLSEHKWSLMTISIYLKARPVNSGGATQFLQDEMDFTGPDETGRIQAPPGMVRVSVEGDSAGKSIVFWHEVMHQGEALNEDCEAPKWLLITQVLYQRDPATAPKLTEDERMARVFLKQAEEAESQGNIQDAICSYNKAYRLDPSLE